jgi:hypothetical protein
MQFNTEPIMTDEEFFALHPQPKLEPRPDPAIARRKMEELLIMESIMESIHSLKNFGNWDKDAYLEPAPTIDLSEFPISEQEMQRGSKRLDQMAAECICAKK